MVHPFGCHTWYKTNALADEWRDKITLVKTTYGGKVAYRIKGLPCWTYDLSAYHDPEKLPDSLMTVYNSKGCWYGICHHHSKVHTAILQERTKGGWNIVDGVPLKAVSMIVESPVVIRHHTMEIYIKNKGYFVLDVDESRTIMAPELAWWVASRTPYRIGNRHFCDTSIPENYIDGYYVPYDPEWAGFPRHEIPSEPKKSYLDCTSAPANASIWLKKH